MLLSPLIVSVLSLLFSGIFAHPTIRDDHEELHSLAKGNQRYRAKMQILHPGLLGHLAEEGQHPPFLLYECSDSRVREALIFDLLPGDMFTSANIANQFHSHDSNTLSVLSYAVDNLHVQHVIVMGHYGCGGVQAAILQAPVLSSSNGSHAIQEWIRPIHDIYLTSSRPEIVQYRNAHEGETPDSHLDRHEPVFRAMVEENIKANVLRVYESSVIREFYENGASSDSDIFVHGLVYDMDAGRVYDLRVSMGPPGVSVPIMPFPIPSQ